MNKKNQYSSSINDIKVLSETTNPANIDIIIQRSKKIIEDSSDSYEGKEPLYVMRLNNLLNNCIQEIENQITRKKEILKKQEEKQNDNSFIEQNNMSQDFRTQIELVQIEIKQSTQILNDYKKQMNELESKRIRFMDTKYRYELGTQIKDIQNIISGLKQYCNVNREKKKRQELQLNKTQLQRPQSLSSSNNNLSFKNIKPIDYAKDPKDTKDKKQNTEVKNTQPSQEKSKKSNSPLKKIRSPQKKLQKASNVDITKVEVIDNNYIIEKSRYLSEEVDILNQRNTRMKGKVEQLEKLLKNLSSKSIKIDKKYDELRIATKENQVCELPDSESRYKKLILKCAALEKKILLNNNIYQQSLKEGQINLDKVENIFQLMIKLNQTCLERQETVEVLSQKVLEIRKKIEELKQIQQTLNITLDKPLQSSIIQSNKALKKLIIIEKNMEQQEDTVKKETPQNIQESLYSENKSLNDVINDGQLQDLDESKQISDTKEYDQDQQFQEENQNLNQEQNDNSSRLELVPKIFEPYNDGKFITDVDQAQKILKDTFREVYNKDYDPTQEVAEYWLKMYGSDGQLTREQFEKFLVENLDDYALKISQ